MANASKGSERRGEESPEMRLRSGVEKSRVVTAALARELSAREPPHTDDLFSPVFALSPDEGDVGLATFKRVNTG